MLTLPWGQRPAQDSVCKELKMNCWIPFLSLLAFLPLVTSTCPSSCHCGSNIVNCMQKELTESSLPASFSPSTRMIYLNGNQLTSLPSGLLDNLKGLQAVHLWENPWQCDCNILYLRSWLQWQQNRTLYKDVVCASPEHLQGRIIAYLSEDEIISTCQYWYCSMALVVQICLFVFLFLQAVLLLCVISSLRRFKRLVNKGRMTTEETREHVNMWSPFAEDGYENV